MSLILDTTAPLFSIENAAGGLDIFGFEEEENRLNGSHGNDRIVGGNLDDTLFGLAGNDKIFGAGGDDVIAGGLGEDTLTGGLGADAFEFFAEDFALEDSDYEDSNSEVDFITDFDPGKDIIRLNGITSDSSVMYNPETGLLSVDGIDVAQLPRELEISADNFEFRLCGTDEDDLVEGGSGDNDVIISGIGQDTLVGGAGKDDFLFNINDDFLADEIDIVADFNVDEDTIRLEGISSDAHVNYNRETGILSVDGNDIAQLDSHLDITDDNYEII